MATPSLTSTARTTPLPTPAPSRINLLDNTVPVVSSSLTPSVSDDNLPSTASSAKAPGRRETLRKAIAQRKYRRWGPDHFPNDEYLTGVAMGSEGSPYPRAAGVVERVGEPDEEIVAGGSVSDSWEGGSRGWERSDTGGDKRKTNGVGENGERRARRKKHEKEVAEIDILYENQRGMFICGIPFFSAKGLLNFDPDAWQDAHYRDSAVSIVDAQVPDPSWTWAWKTWYVDMTSDVDEEGWTYSFSFNPTFSWHGTHIWFHSFVRRRRWLRKRVKLHGHRNGSACSSRNGSRERGHELNQDYFTIHSHSRQTKPDGSIVVGGNRRSVMGGEGWSWKGEDGDGKEDSEQAVEEEINDIPMLMNVLRTARLDREKVEAVANFLREGGEEVEYLVERIPTIMELMIFQASRWQLLSLIIEEAETAEKAESSPATPAGDTSAPLASLPPLPPLPSEPTTPLSQISVPPQKVLPPSSPAETSHPPPELQIADEAVSEEPADEPEVAQKAKERLRRRIKALKGSVVVAEKEVQKTEYWSDITGVFAGGETTLVSDDEIGPTFTAGVREGGKGVGSPSAAVTTVTVDWKGKWKDTSI